MDSSRDEDRLVLAALDPPPLHELDAGLEDESVPQPSGDCVAQRPVDADPLCELDFDRNGWILPRARRGWLDEDPACDRRRELADDLADRRREDVHATHDQ